ncbi:MAG: DUF2399 domain-containing protein [Thermoflexales bacterium]|nr:DUF2399 domain-containing protein [Thermoflexales bacterium]
MAFLLSPDVSAILNALLDIYERRGLPSPSPAHAIKKRCAIRCDVQAMALPGYHSQADPLPRQVANEQLAQLEQQGHLKLAWLPGQEHHLLASVSLVLDAERAEALFAWLERTPASAQRARLRDLLLGERFRFVETGGWRLAAVQHSLAQLRAGKSPAPFSLTDEEFDRDLLAAMAALDEVNEETPYRVFSVRTFNDSKRFEHLRGALVVLARRHQAEWAELAADEILRELGLVANPGHLYLYGPWRLVDETGIVLSLDEFYPSVGLPAAQASRLARVEVDASRVVCVENPTAFYELVRHEGDGLAALCLWGNPSPACRYLLVCLTQALPPDVPLQVWADLDYGGLRILAHLRHKVSPRFEPYRMDVPTFEAHAAWARPLARGDARNLRRLAAHPLLADVSPLIEHMLARGLKLEQEAVTLLQK